ncbi:MAG TPA: ThiF family adenylyltransferase [Microbacteriaceae bacterium]|nr:ThiF family adenylyltransferase [Microbacteriaceae bacterium]
MSFDPWSHSSDLQRLVAADYELEVTGDGYLLVHNVPYLNEQGAIERGIVVSKLELNGDVTVNPVEDHVAYFIGSKPYRWNGEPLTPLTDTTVEVEGGRTAHLQMSLKSPTGGHYPDYFEKIKHHVQNIENEAKEVDASVTARTGGPCIINQEGWPFEYADTASGRAGIGAINARLAGQRIAIVGVGGTGSYILDLVAKCPVHSIDLYDGDRFSSHNAFRAPGAASLEEVRAGELKVERFAEIYSRMKRNVVPHPYNIGTENVSELDSADFIFLAMEGGATKLAIVEALEAVDKPFVNASLGVKKPGGGDVLQAIVEVNGSTPDQRDSFREKVDFGEIDLDDVYTENIQVADLNALNAAMAVLWWKKWAGVYVSSKPAFWMLVDTYLDAFYTDRV